MIKSRPCSCRWKNIILRLARALPLLAIAIGFTGRALATGFFGPSEYLAQGGQSVNTAPEFYWDLEVKRLSKDFHPQEKLLDDSADAGGGEEVKPDTDVYKIATAKADKNDFAAALKDGQIKPPDPAKATQQHEAARDAIAIADDKTTTAPPAEFDSEFADYHRGAFAYRLGKDHWDEAKKAWEALLKRPAADRNYRTVWAAFMLGKLALKNGDPAAVKWFEQTRQFAKAGFADSLGMAADSYGWEGRSEWKQNHPEKAAPLFLTQLALGDESAVVSLKALIPDRTPVDGLLNYGPELDDIGKWNDEQKHAAEEKTLLALKAAAADPLLRKLVTAHILATESSGASYGDSKSVAGKRCSRWLSMIKEAKVDTVEDAEYLGWVAYINGDYKEAARWLELEKNDTPAACWLRAKLLLRDGKLDDAVKNMAKAWGPIHDTAGYADGWEQSGYNDDFVIRGDDGSWTFSQAASGDLGGLHLARGDFVQALDVFRKGGLWEDAAFVAERVLTADELKTYVDKIPPAPAPVKKDDEENENADPDNSAKLKYLLGRRLVREDRYAEAAAYLPAPYDKILGKYVRALKDGADEKLPKLQRAQAWFTAAWIARYDGMELMGTEVAPDGFVSGGDFENTDLADQRLTGTYVPDDGGEVGSDGTAKKAVAVPIALKTSKQELERLEKNKIRPDVRYHYRLIAGVLAVRAGGFLADNSEELADVINTAGGWVKDRDEKTGDSYYQILKKRAAKTKIGHAVLAKHWFVDQAGPWSEKQQTAYDAMHKELDPPKPAQQ